LDERLSKALIGSVSLYNYKFSNLIETRYDSVSLVKQFTDYNKVNANGIEIEINAKLKEDLDVRTSYSFQYAKLDEADNRKSSSTCHLAKFALVLPVFENVYISTDMLYEYEKFTTIDTKTRSFYLANANLLIKDIFNHFDVSFKINNLTDKNYFNNFIFKPMNDQPEVNQIGRNFIFKVEYNF
jgi:outer membrane cobalamin receptor